jgi:D-arginine dehydrogenase
MSDGCFDIAVIGGGMAGASVAYELAADANVVVIEMEDQPGYHTTGRSAAVFTETYGPAPIRALTRHSRAFFENPPDLFCDSGLLNPRGILFVAREDQEENLDTLYRTIGSQPGIRRVDRSELSVLSPLLRRDYAVAGVLEEGARDIDVNGLHQGYLRGLRQRGGQVISGAEVESLERDAGDWKLRTRRETYSAPVVVNAAGAWADAVAALAGATPIGLMPKRRTIVIVAAPEGIDPDHWPGVVDVDEQFYLKPDAGRLLISPADETPSEPCDAQPEELDIAICVDRIQRAFDLEVQRVQNSWAGLRSFVADRSPVCGFDPDVDGFFWLAGQGGYGIQSAPGLSQLAAALIAGNSMPTELGDRGFDLSDVSPSRLERTRVTDRA